MKQIAFALFLFSMPLAAQEQLRLQTNDLFRPTTATNAIVIPAAGNVVGGGGTFFRSDINVMNFANRAQTVQLFWLPQGQDGSSIPPRTVTFNPLSGFSSEDFVGAIMQQNGLGAIYVRGVLSDGVTADSTAQLHATARIWTPYPAGGTGNMSQTFPALVVSGLVSNRQWIFGVRRDDRYRLNLGIVNFSNAPQDFVIRALGSMGTSETTTVTLPAMSMQQLPLTGPGSGTFQIAVENSTTTNRSTSWTSYASSIDNTTGDAWSMTGFEAAGQ